MPVDLSSTLAGLCSGLDESCSTLHNPGVAAGAKVWLTAAWVNPRGPLACTPVMSGIGYEGAAPMAA